MSIDRKKFYVTNFKLLTGRPDQTTLADLSRTCVLVACDTVFIYEESKTPISRLLKFRGTVVSQQCCDTKPLFVWIKNTVVKELQYNPTMTQ